jgi:GTP-binding protein Era
MQKAGFISFVGRPNVGKSTLMNMLVGEKIAIMSPVAQTTRTAIQGIVTNERGQMIIVDTPGIHKPKDALGSFMNDIANISSDNVDVVAFIIPANEQIGKGDLYILNQLIEQADHATKIIAVVSKIDTIGREKLLEKLNEVANLHDFAAVVPVSAKKRDNLETLEDVVFSFFPESPYLYDPEESSMQSDAFVVKEFIREKVLHLTKEELPHAIAVVIDAWEDEAKELIITASIIVERKSQKAIIIGKTGSMIKKIRQQAERDLKRHFDKKVILELWVKVEKNWRSNPKYLHTYGYNINDYKE